MTRPLTTCCPDTSHSPKLVAGTGWTCPDCDQGRQPSPLARIHAAIAERDAGMARATSAHPDEASRVAAAIRQLAAQGRPFSANDAREIHGVKGGVVGATFTALRKEGVIKPVGDEISTDKGTHGHRIYRWIGAAA